MYRSIRCPICQSSASLKGTKTNHLMLRCDFCRVIIFANGPYSQDWLSRLP